MSDGTVLRADVYRPDDGNKYPVLFRRTPYRKEGWGPFGRRLAEAGYVVIIQDIRGRGASDGEFIWSFADEAQTVEGLDGYDSVEWCGRYEYSNGAVGTWGHSYDGWSQLRTAALQPPSLATMHIAGITARFLDMTRGILDPGRRMEWCYTLGADLANRQTVTAGVPVDRDKKLTDRWANFERGKWLWFLPLAELPEHALTGASKFFQDYLARVNVEVWGFDQVLDKVQVPTAFLTGWWDRFSDTAKLYNNLVAAGPAELAARHTLLMGPWSHNPDTFVPDLGDAETGGQGGLDYLQTLVDWFDARLKNDDAALAEPVRYFNVGENAWRTSPAWPPAAVVEQSLFLHSGGSAANLDGADGTLSAPAPGDEPADQYSYDPRDPVMSLMLDDSHHAPKDQSPNDSRPDVLHYQGPVLTAPVDVTGTPRVRLWASTDAPDTDWVVRLIDAGPDSAINVCSGIMRARYRNSYEKEEFLVPGTPTEFVIDMSVTSYSFQPGHRIRLDITSSDFPNFDRNHNTEHDFAVSAELRTARQTVHHSQGLATELVLPVMPAQEA